MYHYICHTCKEDEVFRELADAQARFNEHADDRHNVEIIRVGSSSQRGYPEGLSDSDDDRQPSDAGENGHTQIDMTGSETNPTVSNADPD